jgi:hypothetical protein
LTLTLASALAVAVAGCGDDRDTTGPGPVTSPTTSAEDGDPDGGTGDDDEGGDGDHDGIYDVGSADDGGGHSCNPDDPNDPDCNCTGVDILFIIDNSGSMGAHQAALAEMFPLFVDVMIEALPSGTDLHVGITTQGGFWTGEGTGSWPLWMCVTDANPYPEGFTPPTEGHNGGNGDQGRLYEHEGQRYFEMKTDQDPQPLKDWFSTAATLPDADSPQEDQVELLSAAAAYPFHEANATHNEGFVRDEGAVLLLFFLTDTSDITPESADSLADIVRSAKSGCGGDDCILTAGMVDPNSNCNTEYPRLTEFLSAFGKPPASLGDISGPGGGGWPPPPAPPEEYEKVLGDALAEVLAQTCADIPPEG